MTLVTRYNIHGLPKTRLIFDSMHKKFALLFTKELQLFTTINYYVLMQESAKLLVKYVLLMKKRLCVPIVDCSNQNDYQTKKYGTINMLS